MFYSLFVLPFILAVASTPADIQKELTEFANISSGSDNEEGLTNSAKFLKPLLEELGFDFQWDLENRSLKASRPVKNKKADILFVGHIDTVFLKGTEFLQTKTISYPADDWRSKLGPALRGPGVSDAKGGVILILEILRSLPVEWRDKIQFRILLAADEERGSHLSVKTLENLVQAEMPDMAFVFEPGWIEKDGPRIPTHIAGNFHLQIAVHRPTEHAAISEHKGQSAVDGLIEVLSALQKMRKNGLAVNFYQIDSRSPANVTAEVASAQIAIRFKTLANREKIISEIKKIKLKLQKEGSRLEIISEKIISEPQDVLSNANLLLIQKAAAAIGQKVPARSVAMGRGAESFLAKMKVPTLPAMGPYGIDFHSENETLFLNSFPERMRLCHELLKNILERKIRTD